MRCDANKTKSYRFASVFACVCVYEMGGRLGGGGGGWLRCQRDTHKFRNAHTNALSSTLICRLRGERGVPVPVCAFNTIFREFCVRRNARGFYVCICGESDEKQTFWPRRRRRWRRKQADARCHTKHRHNSLKFNTTSPRHTQPICVCGGRCRAAKPKNMNTHTHTHSRTGHHILLERQAVRRETARNDSLYLGVRVSQGRDGRAGQPENGAIGLSFGMA